MLQTDAAAAVAGEARLVIVVGPAGTGKTTMLRVAHDQMRSQMRDQTRDRVVFGVAPSAKAARVLEAETGIASDTVAKLLHEWSRSDRLPEDRYRVPVGATVIVDEAGMLSTPSLTHLVTLAQQHQWRLVLVGDPAQLQAVGRGGMFAELCRTIPVHPLTKVHRFVNQWEADASVALRNGDPAAIDTYVAHGRVHAGNLDEHLTGIVTRWLTHTEAGHTCAVTVSSNEHADLVNHAIQTARQLDQRATAHAADGAVFVGDVIATRRNDRQIRTDRGEPVRNRELWTITAIAEAGVIVAAHNGGGGTVRLPADYVAQHVQLGYAVTEHGNQGATTDHAVALVTPATTKRGLYVAATRGRHTNDLLVIADTADTSAAIGVLNGILTIDRADTPAVTLRRTLAATPTARTAPTVPGQAEARQALREANSTLAGIDSRIERLRREVENGRWQVARQQQTATTAGLLKRRAARADLADTQVRLTDLETRLADAIAEREPVVARRAAAARASDPDRADRGQPGGNYRALSERWARQHERAQERTQARTRDDLGIDLGL